MCSLLILPSARSVIAGLFDCSANDLTSSNYHFLMVSATVAT